MLDLNKLSHQIRAATFEFKEDQANLKHRKALALQAFNGAIQEEATIARKLIESAELMPWTLAQPLEMLNKKSPLPSAPNQYEIVATDGSQISPSRHEISPCYLINIGKILFSYGTGKKARQESEPFLYYRQKDLYTYHKWQHMSISEMMIGLERTLMEFHELAKLCEEAKASQDTGLPTLALVDGTLMGVLIDLYSQPTHIQEEALSRFVASLELMQSQQVPICSYISQSRKSECLHFLRLVHCPFDLADCEKNCSEGDESCKGVMPLADQDLWWQVLKPGERSPLFTHTLTYPESLRPHKMCFFYLHVGSEMARIEFPRWVADSPEWLDLIHSLCFEQVKKGQGYPIALAEAHHRAVVKSRDRSQFYAMLSHKMLNERLIVNLSNKELRKRSSLV